MPFLPFLPREEEALRQLVCPAPPAAPELMSRPPPDAPVAADGHTLGPAVSCRSVFGATTTLRGEMKVPGKPAMTWDLWTKPAPRRVAVTEGLLCRQLLWRQTGSFAHNAPDGPGLSGLWRPGRALCGTRDLARGHILFLTVQCWAWCHQRRWASPPGEQSSACRVVFQERTPWGRARPALSLHHIMCARKPGVPVFLIIWI